MAQSTIFLPTITNANIWIETSLGATAEQIKSTSATIYIIDVDNTANSSPTFVKLYDATSGNVTVGTTAPDWTFKIPNGIRVVIVPSGGVATATALTAAALTTGGTGGTSSPASACIVKITYV